jgi:hypothetical protein
MQKPPLEPDIADEAPNASVLTGYDEQHLVTYLRLLNAENDGADWTDVARIVLHLDPDREPERARRRGRLRHGGDPEFLRDHSGSDDGSGQHVVKQCQQPEGRAAAF